MPGGKHVQSMFGVVVRSGGEEEEREMGRVGAAPSLTSEARRLELITEVSAGRAPKVEQLLVQGAFVDTATAKGDTLLYLACERGHTDTVRCLVKFGANLNFVNTQDAGNTCLHIACLNGHSEAALYLVDCGLEVNVRNDLGRTPLHSAAWMGRSALCVALINCGADIRLRDNDGYTPVDLLNISHIPESVELNVGGLPITDRQLQRLFQEHDSKGEGLLPEAVVREIVAGLDVCDEATEGSAWGRLLRSVGCEPGGEFDFVRFSQLMLKVAQW